VFVDTVDSSGLRHTGRPAGPGAADAYVVSP